MTISPFM